MSSGTNIQDGIVGCCVSRCCIDRELSSSEETHPNRDSAISDVDLHTQTLTVSDLSCFALSCSYQCALDKGIHNRLVIVS